MKEFFATAAILINLIFSIIFLIALFNYAPDAWDFINNKKEATSSDLYKMIWLSIAFLFEVQMTAYIHKSIYELEKK